MALLTVIKVKHFSQEKKPTKNCKQQKLVEQVNRGKAL